MPFVDDPLIKGSKILILFAIPYRLLPTGFQSNLC